MRKEVRLDQATRLINHSPVLLVSSVYEGRMDISPVAWHMPISKDPPTVVMEISDGHFIYECIKHTGDLVINIPSRDLAEKIVKCGSCSGRDVDKFGICGLTAETSVKVRSPRLKEALAVMECVLVRDDYLMEKYNMVPAEVKYAEAEEKAFDEHWLFAREGLKTIHHLGDRTFCVPGSKVLDLRKR